MLWKTDGTAEGTQLVSNVNLGTTGANLSGLATDGERLYFNNSGTVWTSDGSADGTVPLVPGLSGNTFSTAVLGGELYFTASQTTGNEAWKTDGTAAGTVPVADLNPGAASSNPMNFYSALGKVFFSADGGPGIGRGLWATDGSAVGTSLLKPAGPSGPSNPTSFREVNGTVFFAADALTGRQLWRTDGTTAGTVLVRAINPGLFNGGTPPFATAGGVLLFFANDGISGAELWSSDGTLAGTHVLKDIRPGAASSIQGSGDFVTNTDGFVYFFADNGVNGLELWKSDGTADGTVMVKDLSPGSAGTSFFGLTAAGGTLYFSAQVPGSAAQIYRTDGTADGTVQVTNYAPAAGGLFGTAFSQIAGQVVFQGFNPATGFFEVFALDGSAAGAGLVRDIFPGTTGSTTSGFVRAGGLLYFVANDGLHGTELWTIARPDAVLDAPSGGVSSETLSFTVGAHEPTLNDPSTVYAYSINWGDGSTQTLSGVAGTQLTHSYAAPGTYDVTLTVTDPDGFSSEPTTAAVQIDDVQLRGDTLAIGGTGGDDAYVISPADGGVRVQRNGVDLGVFAVSTVEVFAGAGDDSVSVVGTLGNDAFTLDGQVITRDDLTVVMHDVESAQMLGLDGADTFAVPHVPAGLAVAIGGDGNDRLSGPAAGGLWLLTGQGAGSVGSVTFVGMRDLTGGAGDDAFRFSAGASLVGELDGGAGENTLDYTLGEGEPACTILHFGQVANQ
jgi:ELWxxDGT repeat protein